MKAYLWDFVWSMLALGMLLDSMESKNTFGYTDWGSIQQSIFGLVMVGIFMTYVWFFGTYKITLLIRKRNPTIRPTGE